MIATILGVWSDWSGDDPEVIREVSAVVDQFVEGHKKDAEGKMSAEAFLSSPSWDEVKAAAGRLSYPNSSIAQAKALVVLDSQPEPYGDYEWRERFVNAAKSYRECTTPKRALVAFGFGTVALIVAVPSSWLLLLLISWVWYFALDRIRELSRAIQARRDEDA